MIVPDDVEPELVAAIEALTDEEIAALDQVVIAWQYIDADGTRSWQYRHRGDDRATSAVGLLEAMKIRMLTPQISTDVEAFRDTEPPD